MFLKQNRLKAYKLYKHQVKRNSEGARIEAYADTPLEIKAEIWSANGTVQAEIYGSRLAYMMNMLCNKDVDIDEKDGISVYTSDKPDYKVISIKRWSNHLQIELEAIRGV